MTGWRSGGAGVSVACLIGVATPATAQLGNGAAPVTIPGPGPTAIAIPPAPVIVLPTPLASATPRSTPTPAAVASPLPAASRAPTARASATPPVRPTPTPTPSATPLPAPSAAPAAAPPVAPTPVATATPTPTPSASAAPLPPVAADDGVGRYWLAALAAGAIALGALAWVLLRRRRSDAVERVEEEPWIVEAVPVTAAAEPRARLTLAFRPRRAGVNLLSATSENEIVVTNAGDAPADDIRLQVRLLSAHAAQDAELAGFYAEPIGRPAVPAFALTPGETRAMNVVAALPRDAIRSLTAAGRPMFVPIVAVNLIYAGGAGEGQLAQAFAVGVERVDSSKLAPFWLDTPPRTYDQVAARAHAAPLER